MASRSVQRKRTLQRLFFEDKVCAACGSKESLQIDHVDLFQKADALKRKQGSSQLWFWSQERRDAELAKCQILCLPCHKAKTEANSENGLKGSAHSQAKLTDTDVLTIRKLAAEGVKQKELASRFDVSYSQINRIVNRKKWIHI